MAMIKCPECGHDISDKADKCINCGCPILTSSGVIEQNVVKNSIEKKTEGDGIMLIRCPICGALVSRDAESCPKCGKKDPNDNNKAVAKGCGIAAAIVGGIFTFMLLLFIIMVTPKH